MDRNGAIDVPGHAQFEADPAAHHDVVLDGARLAALKDIGLLDTGAEEDFDRYTRLATDLLGVPVSLVSLVDADRQFFKSHTGLPAEFADQPQTPLSHSLCQYAMSSQQPLVVSDAREHPLVADNLAVRDLGVIAYAGMPLVLSGGHAVGAFCAIDGTPREWSERDLRILRDLAAAVVAQLEVRKALADQSLRDRLTGLPNHTMLRAQAEQLLAAADPAVARSVAAICIGLDGFGLVNDAYGAAAADRLLQQVAERLVAAADAQHMLGRLGGDAFVVLGHDMNDEHATIPLAEQLRAAVSGAQLRVGGQPVELTATVGVAGGRQGRSGGDLLIAAENAMRRAKASRRPVLIAAEDSGDVAAAQLRLRSALSGALDRGEFRVAYQPIVDLSCGRTLHYEALARWTNPQLGAVAPAVFIPAAARTGDIVKIGEWVLRSACAQLAQWRRDGSELSMAVNLDPLQLQLPSLRSVVQSALTEHDLPASALTLEITEEVLIGAGALQTRNLQEVRQLGVRISLDDFGTGYCALNYLKRFPIDELKIDRSFVQHLGSDPRDSAIVRAILTLAEDLGLTVVAEGIETTEQLALLRQLGCGLGQGYLFAPPRPAAELDGHRSRMSQS